MINKKIVRAAFTAMCLMMAFGVEGFAQKQYKGIKSVDTTVEKFSKTGSSSIKYTETTEKFDAEGRVVEESTFDEKGNLLKRKTFTYDANGNKVGAIIYKPNGEVDDRVEYKYENGLRTEKITYSAKGKVKSRKTYNYTR